MPWGLILSIGLKLLGLGLDRKKANEEVRKAFLNFVDKMEEFQLASVKLNDEDRKQVDELRQKKRELHQKKRELGK